MDIALSCIARGWSVFPCKVESKEPLYIGAYKDASRDESKIREWAARSPVNAKVGIAPCICGITVLDVDTGLKGEESLAAFLTKYNIPVTFAVRTGKRPDYRVQLYFQHYYALRLS